jgi:hypothetical protein
MSRKTTITLVALFLTTLLFHPAAPFTLFPEADSFTTEVWKPIEIILTSTISYSNPYKNVDVSATFNGPGGLSMTMPGFWDGGSTWRIRFAPTQTGNWSYTTISTDTANTGLHNKTGTITVNAYTGTQDIYRHGFIRPSSNNRFPAHADGTPFYWLGDTHWMGFSYRERLNTSNDPDFTSMFKGMVDRRVSQGYTVYQAALFLGEWGDVSQQPTPNSGTYVEGGHHPWTGTGYQFLASSGTAQGDFTPYSAEHAIDGIADSKWESASSSFPQWARIDLGAAKALGRVETEFPSNQTWRYRLEGSNDDSTYSTLVDRTSGVTGQSFNDTVSGTYRYVRITITGAASGKAALNEFRVYDSSNALYNNRGLFEQINPAFFQNLDQRIQYIAGKGMHTHMGLDWGRYLQNSTTMVEGYKRAARYVLARYGAYPTSWFTAGEVRQSPYVDGWKAVMAHVDALDPYQRLNTVHNTTANINERGSTGYNMVMLQLGHQNCCSATRNIGFWKSQYDSTPTLPVLESEANYEQLNSSITATIVRETAWQAQVAGSFGFTYGSQGLWQATWDGSDNWQCFGSSCIPWYTAIDHVGGAQMTYVASFFKAIDWASLAPDNSAVTWDAGAPTSGTQQPYQKARADRSLLVAHIPTQTSLRTGTVNGLNAAKQYRAQWYNPRNGSYTLINGSITSVTSWSIPAPQDLNDWVLLFEEVTGTAPTFQPPTNTPIGSTGGTSFVTGVSANGTLRNNSTTYIGMKITIGGSNITVTELGRYFIAGNNQNHILKIIRVSDGAEIASTTISMGSGSIDGLGFKYAVLSPSITLSANTSYYIVSQETNGGDYWHDNLNTTLTTTTAAAINGSVYQNGASWVENGSAGLSYVPVNFKYTAGATTTSTPLPTVTVDDSVMGTAQNQFNYVGSGWGHCLGVSQCGAGDTANPPLYNISNSWNAVTNEYVTFTFTGTQIRFYGTIDTNLGIGAVSIDNGAETNIDFYSATRKGNQLLWTSPVLSAGTHTFKLRVTSTKNPSSTYTAIAVDRVDVLP